MGLDRKQQRALFILCLMTGISIAYHFIIEGSHELKAPITVIYESEMVEQHLAPFKDVIGDDYEGYRNHVYRVLTYSLHFLRDVNHPNRPQIEMALAYHDIGLWADGALGYLEPSLKRASEAASAEPEWSEEMVQLVRNIVYWHHKITAFEGPHAEVVNAVRCADTADFTLGHVNHGLPWVHMNTVMYGKVNNETQVVEEEGLPVAGFHMTLLKFPHKVYGWKDLHKGIMQVATIFKW